MSGGPKRECSTTIQPSQAWTKRPESTIILQVTQDNKMHWWKELTGDRLREGKPLFTGVIYRSRRSTFSHGSFGCAENREHSRAKGKVKQTKNKKQFYKNLTPTAGLLEKIPRTSRTWNPKTNKKCVLRRRRRIIGKNANTQPTYASARATYTPASRLGSAEKGA